MKNRSLLFAILLAFSLVTLSGCSFIGDIFRAGVWLGVIIVVAVIIIILFLISKLRRKG